MHSPLAAPVGRAARHVVLLGIALALATVLPAGAVFAAIDDPPAPDGPGGVVNLLKWCWNHRDAQRYRDLFTADYEFVPSAPDLPWGRDAELNAVTALFGPGTGTQAGATSIVLDFLGNPQPGTCHFPDRAFPLHQQLMALVTMHINRSDGSALDVGGVTLLYLVRGDVAAIPAEMQARGIGPDSTRWYVERWDDVPPLGVSVDHVPVLTVPASVSAYVGQPLWMGVTATDPDGDAITSLTAAGIPPGATFTPSADQATGRFAWVPAAADTGTHPVTFTASNALSASATTAVTVLQNLPPKAVVTVSPSLGNEPLLVRVDASASYDPDGMIHDFRFDFGDGTSLVQGYPITTHTYKRGQWIVTVTATDNRGAQDSAKVAVLVNGHNSPPVAALLTSTTSGKAPLTVTFNAGNSNDPDGRIVSYRLAYGDGVTDTLRSTTATHTYTAIGRYSALLTVTDNEGATGTAGATILANPDRPPVVSVSGTTTVVAGSPLALGVSASDPDGDPIGSLIARGVPAGATFTAAADHGSGSLAWAPGLADTGAYRVTFVAVNSLTDSATTTITVAAHPPDRPPVVTAPGYVTAKVGRTMGFVVGVSDPDGDAITSLTALGAPATSTFEVAADHASGTFSWTPASGDVGPNDLILTFTAANALSGQATTRIRVVANLPPVAVLTPQGTFGNEPLVVDFSAAGSSDPDGQIVRYRFVFGDGSSIESFSPTVRHAYMAGYWTCQVFVTDDAGATSMAGATVNVSATPFATATKDAITRFAQAWNDRSLDEYRRLLTSDFRFDFAPGDSVGALFGGSWSRDDELLTVGRMFSGGNGAVPPASSVDLKFLENPLVGTSYTPGHGYPWHAQVLIPRLSLDVTAGGVTQRAEGQAFFSLVRGDSAQLSPDVLALGVHPDSTQWFVDGWRDLTGPSTPPNQPPVAALAVTPATGLEPLTAMIDASRSQDDGTIVGYRFDFGDGITVTRAVPFAVHTFQAGVWTVRVTAIDDQGAESSASLTMNVWAAGSQPNLAKNPSFETDMRYWTGYAGAVLERVPGGHDGTMAVQATGPPVINGSFGVNDSPDMIHWTLGPGLRYRYTAWVRSPSSHGQAKLRVTEYMKGTGARLGLVTSAPVTLSPDWQQLTVEYTTTSINSTLDFQVRDFPAVPSEVLVADDIAVRNVTSQGASSGMTDWGDVVDGSETVALEPRLVPIPMREGGTLRFLTSRTGALRVEILDLAGRRVRQVMDEREAAAGVYELAIGRSGEGGARLGAGVYFWRVVAAEGTRNGRFVVLP